MENYNNKLLNQYNSNRRLIDHRVPKDFNHGLNKPMYSKSWILSQKNRFLYEFLYNPGLYLAFGGLAFGFALFYFDFVMNNKHTDDDDRGRLQANFSKVPGYKYLSLNQNAIANMGNWNHNFSCFENEANCGRDVGLTFLKKQ